MAVKESKQVIVNGEARESECLRPFNNNLVNVTSDFDSQTQKKEKEAFAIASLHSFCGLSSLELEAVAQDFPQYNVQACYDRFVATHTKKGTKKATLKQWRGWLETMGDRITQEYAAKVSGGVVAPAPATQASAWERKKVELKGSGKKLLMAWGKDKSGEEVRQYRVGSRKLYPEEVQKIENLPIGTDEQIHQAIYDITGIRNIDTPTAMNNEDIAEYLLKPREKPGVEDPDTDNSSDWLWSGASYKTAEEKEQARIAEEAAKKRKVILDSAVEVLKRTEDSRDAKNFLVDAVRKSINENYLVDYDRFEGEVKAAKIQIKPTTVTAVLLRLRKEPEPSQNLLAA